MAYPYNQAGEIQKLINLYRARPDLFESEEIERLGLKAEQLGISFRPLEQHVNVRNLAGQFSGGFVEGFTTIPIADRPRTTYESIARSLGHLAGFAPSILTVPMKGLASIAGKMGAKKLQKATGRGIQHVAKFGEYSLPMIGSRYAKRGVDKIIEKTKLEALDLFKHGGVGRAISNEAIGLGTASVVSNIWHGPDEYMNSFVGGAIAGGAFGGIGNFVRLGNVFKSGSPDAVKRAESALKAGIGASVLGLPSTLRGEPVEMQLYEYLLGGFFGYQSRPAHEQAGSKFIRDLQFSDKPAEHFSPDKSPKWGSASRRTKEYVNDRATEQSERYLGMLHPDKDVRATMQSVLERTVEKPTKAQVDEALRSKAYETYMANREIFESEQARLASYITNTQEDFMDGYEVQEFSKMQKANRAYANQLSKEYASPQELANDIDALIKNSEVNNKPNVERFMELYKDKSYSLGSQNEARRFYHQQSSPVEAVMVADLTGKTVVFTNELGKVTKRYSFGRKAVNIPLNELAEGSKFEVLTHVKKNQYNDKGKLVGTDYENIFRTDIDHKNNTLEYNISNKELLDMQIGLANNEKYIFSGVKDKNYSIVAEFVDANTKGERIRIDDIYNAISSDKKSQLRKIFKQSLKDEIALADNPKGKKRRFVETLHERKFVSNILHDANINGLYAHRSADFSNLNVLFNEGYGKNVIDFNKRMQGYLDSGIPQIAESFKTITDGKYRVMLVDDVHNWSLPKDIKKAIKNNTSDSDGATFFEQSFFKEGSKAMGLPKDAGHFKPVIIGRSPFGNLFNKSNGQMAHGAIQEFMKTHGIQVLTMDSSAKIRGQAEPVKLKYEGGKIIAENAQSFEMGIESLRINPSTFENPKKFSGDINIPLQLGNVLNTLQTPEAIDKFYKHFVEPSISGSKEAVELVKTNPKEIIKKLGKEPSYIDELPVKYIVEKLAERNTDMATAIRKAFQKIRPETAEVELDTDKTYNAYHDVNRLLFDVADGMYIPNAVSKVMRKPYENSLRKYIIKRYRNPNVRTAGKAWLKGVTPDMIGYSDMVKHSRLKEGEVLLDEYHRRTPAIFNGKETTLGKIWKDYKSELKAGRDVSAYEDALTLLAIRTPADSVSGIRVLKLRGFTKQKGAGAITNHKDNEYLGGADKDSDYISFFQGVPKSLRGEYAKYSNERAHINKERKAKLEKEFGTNESGIESELASKWSPSMRINVHKGARKGLQGLGYGLSAKEYLLEVAHQVQKMGGKYEETYTTSGGYEAKIRLELKENTRDFFDKAYMIVNASADASKYKNITDYNHYRDMLLESLFHVENNYRVRVKGEDKYHPLSFTSVFSPNANGGAGTRFSNISRLIGQTKSKTYGESEGRLFETLDTIRKSSDQFEWGNIAGKTALKMKQDGIDILLDAEMPNVNIFPKKRMTRHTIDKEELSFLKNHISPELERLLIYSTLGKDSGSLRGRNLALDIAGKNIANIAGYELINETALGIYKSFVKSGLNHPKALAEQLNNIANKALSISGQIGKETSQSGKVNNDQANSRYKTLDNEIRDYLTDYIEPFARKNKVPIKDLQRYFELWMLTPYQGMKAGGKYPEVEFSRPIWGSDYITRDSKGLMFKRMDDIYKRASELDTTKGRAKFEVKTFEEFRDLDTDIAKAVKTSSKIRNRIIPKSLKNLAMSSKDVKELDRLEVNLKERPYIASDLNEFFMHMTAELEGVPRTSEFMQMRDVRVMNRYLEDRYKPAKDRSYLGVTIWDYLSDPRSVDRKLQSYEMKQFEQYLTEGGKRVSQVKLKKGLSSLGSMFGFNRKMLTQQNAHIDLIKENTDRYFKFNNRLNKEEQRILLEIISARRNLKTDLSEHGKKIENEILERDEVKRFLSQRVKGKKGEKWVKEYDEVFTRFFEEFGNDWLWTKDAKNKRFDWKSFDKNPTYGTINDYIKYNKDGRLDFNHFLKKIITPVDANKPAPVVGLEPLLRFQYEYVLEKALLESNTKNPKAFREAYRKDKRTLFKDIGYIDPVKYFPRMNHGHNKLSQRMRDESIDFIATQKRNEAIASGKTKEEADLIYKKVRDGFNPYIDSSLASSTHLEKPFLDYMLENTGFHNRPEMAMERGKDYIAGFDRHPRIISQYKEQFIRSYFKALTSIQGNNRIDHMLKDKPFDVNISKKRINELKKAGYDSQSEVWGDYLKLYLRDSLGHPTRFTHKMINSMDKGDPLALKKNPYFLTSDHYLSKKLEKLHSRLGKKKWEKYLPFFNNVPKGVDKKGREEYFIRRLHDLGHLEAKYQLVTLLANTGSMVSNVYGGAQMSISSAGLRNFVRSKSDRVVTNKLLKNTDGTWALTSDKGKAVTNRKDLMKWLVERGIIDSYIQNELEYNTSLAEGLKLRGENGKSFLRELKKVLKQDPLAKNETVKELADRYGLTDLMLKSGGVFMQYSERVNRIDAFLSHALQAVDRFQTNGNKVSLKDPAVFEAGMKGIEVTQFLYHSAFRPAFMRTAMGKVLTRFKLFAFQSVRTRKEFYKQAKYYGFEEGTPAFERFKNLFLLDMFGFALASAFAYSLFDTTLPPPFDWIQESGEWLFGDKRERDRAFFGMYPKAIAPLQIVTPPIARIPQAMGQLINGDWERFSDYTIHTLYPFGRLYKQIDKTAEDPSRVLENFMRIPANKFAYRYRRAQEDEERRKRIEAIL